MMTPEEWDKICDFIADHGIFEGNWVRIRLLHFLDFLNDMTDEIPTSAEFQEMYDNMDAVTDEPKGVKIVYEDAYIDIPEEIQCQIALRKWKEYGDWFVGRLLEEDCPSPQELMNFDEWLQQEEE